MIFADFLKADKDPVFASPFVYSLRLLDILWRPKMLMFDLNIKLPHLNISKSSALNSLFLVITLSKLYRILLE